LPPQSVQGGSAGQDDKSDISIAVEAVEIEGASVFIAGHARGGQTVNISANELLLGTAIITPEGRYLVQTQQPLAVGDYIIRADLMDKGGKVLATARVPFRRVEGEKIAAVAPSAPVQEDAQAAEPQPLEEAEGSVIIRKGDNLWTISKRTYGSGLRYTTIYLSNRDQIKNPDLIWPGQVFVMPKEPLKDQDVQQKLQ
jgi:nucleoid-associated protein YgaU